MAQVLTDQHTSMHQSGVPRHGVLILNMLLSLNLFHLQRNIERDLQGLGTSDYKTEPIQPQPQIAVLEFRWSLAIGHLQSDAPRPCIYGGVAWTNHRARASASCSGPLIWTCISRHSQSAQWRVLASPRAHKHFLARWWPAVILQTSQHFEDTKWIFHDRRRRYVR